MWRRRDADRPRGPGSLGLVTSDGRGGFVADCRLGVRIERDVNGNLPEKFSLNIKDLDAAIAMVASSATSKLSRAFLRAAAEGCGYEALHTMIIALLENRPCARDLEALARIGHTSGWDALAGAAIVLQAFSTYGEPKD